MPITSVDFSSLTDDLQEVFNESAKSAIAEAVGLTVFESKETDRLTYDYLVVHGLDVIASVAEGADLPVASTDQGDTATWTQTYYGGIVAITKKMRKFDLFDTIISLIKNAPQDAFDKIDQSLADVLLFGWSTSYTDVYGDSITSLCPDSVALFSTSHTNGVSSASNSSFRNQIRLIGTSTENPPLSREAVVDARRAGRTYKDPEGMMRPVNLNTLLVAPGNANYAERAIYSTGVVGTPNVDINPLKGSVTVKVWPRLEFDSASTDKSSYWYMYDSKKVGNSLKALFAEKPTMDAPEQVYENKNWEYSIDYYYAIGRGFPAYIWGSNATSA